VGGSWFKWQPPLPLAPLSSQCIDLSAATLTAEDATFAKHATLLSPTPEWANCQESGQAQQAAPRNSTTRTGTCGAHRDTLQKTPPPHTGGCVGSLECIQSSSSSGCHGVILTILSGALGQMRHLGIDTCSLCCLCSVDAPACRVPGEPTPRRDERDEEEHPVSFHQDAALTPHSKFSRVKTVYLGHWIHDHKTAEFWFHESNNNQLELSMSTIAPVPVQISKRNISTSTETTHDTSSEDFFSEDSLPANSPLGCSLKSDGAGAWASSAKLTRQQSEGCDSTVGKL
jgi:hypothetical protein